VAGEGSACDGGVESAVGIAVVADAGFAGEFISDGSGRCDATADRGPLSTGAFVRAKPEPLMAIVAPARRPAKITGANFAVRFAIPISGYAPNMMSGKSRHQFGSQWSEIPERIGFNSDSRLEEPPDIRRSHRTVGTGLRSYVDMSGFCRGLYGSAQPRLAG
jgi:hypothetical protein